MTQDRSWVDSVEETCMQLTPPLLLASFESWSYPQGSSDEDRTQAALRREVVKQWVEEEVPKLLSRLHSLLNERKGDSDVSAFTKGCIVVACSAYISPRRESNGSTANNAGREPWTDAKNRRLAIAVLQHPFFTSNQHGQITLTCLHPSLVSYLLIEYLKPIFSASPSRNINVSTGRAAQVNVNLAKGTVAMSGGAQLDDEVMWKGGDVGKSPGATVLGSPVLFDVEYGNDLIRRRHRALGCYNLLYVCCDSLLVAREGADVADPWKERWPLILPPLLAILEDSSPLYRLVGSQILSKTLLNRHFGESNVGSLLLQTGVATLLRQRLESNLTFISTELSAALLQSSAEALLLLSQATTSGLYQGFPAPRNVLQDGGKERCEQLSRLMDEGVIRIWAYAPTTVATMDFDTASNSMEGEDYEASDVINASIDVILRMTGKDALGIGIARYLDLTLEFLTAQMMGLEVRLDRHNATDRAGMTLDREICSARAVEAILIVCKQAPGILTWSSRCLDAAVRCWALLQDHHPTTQIKTLFAHLYNIVKALVDAHPRLMAQQLQKLVELDKAAFASLSSLVVV